MVRAYPSVWGYFENIEGPKKLYLNEKNEK